MEIATHKPESVEAEGGPTAGNPYLGIGLYTIPEAARLLGLRTGKLRRWADEYSFRSRGRDGFSGPLFERDQPELVKHKILTFAALIELQMIRLFREEGVSMPTIRAVANRGAELYRTNHPFAAKRFHTDGKRIFAEAEHALGGTPLPQPTYKGLARYQLALETVATPFFRKFDYEHEEVRRYWPLGKEKDVVLDPARSFGEPIDAASGVSTAALYQLYTAGETIDRIAHWYQVTPESVGSAIEYEQSLPA